jgi:phytanoyl-CoA hydroxylase
MSLTTEQALHFREHGFVTVPDFFTARETAAIQAEIERLQREGYLRNVATDGDGKTPSQSVQNLQMCPMYRHSPLVRALPFAEKVIDAVRRLLGDPLILHLDQVFLKPGRTGLGTNWHQDKP